MNKIVDKIKDIISVDPLTQGKQPELFVGHPFKLDYNRASILICDDDKQRVQGIAQGTFLLAFYDNEDTVEEAILLRALAPASLPTDSAMISSMIEYYKDNLPTSGKSSKLDDFTRYEFSFSGLDCRVLGTFYRNENGKVEFGADLENFFSAHHYSVYKVSREVLGFIVNQRDSPDIIPGNENEFSIGHVRYSSSLRFQSKNKEDKADVFINPADLLGKRTALFGMTRTGKSNTVKKIIEASTEISSKAKSNLGSFNQQVEDNLKSFDEMGAPKYPIGQIVFDINGEYANANMQDAGTAIFEMYEKIVSRYSVLQKKDFLEMKINFYYEIENGFEMISSYFKETGQTNGYIEHFLSVDLSKPAGYDGFNGNSVRFDRKMAAYKCCLYKAGFPLPKEKSLKFVGAGEINDKIKSNSKIDPSNGISYDEACLWFEWVWENYDKDNYFIKYKQDEGKDWAEEDLKSLLAMLCGYRSPGKKNKIYGFKALSKRELLDLHTKDSDSSFEEDITNLLRNGKIVIVDLSQGNPDVQKIFTEKICSKIFFHSMNRFISNEPNNFIQFYFEEAHNLFPKKDDKDLSQIYSRVAKEGAKLNLGMIYATQEVSSISSNILKNTQNWFIAHLNNEDEVKELRKYYDFDDFADSLVRFSAKNDKGFVRMKTYSNPFVVPVQIDKFTVERP